MSGPTHPNSPDYADNFDEAWYDPATDSIYASYEGPGVVLQFPLAAIAEKPGTPEQDAAAIEAASKRDGIWVPAVMNRHTTPRLAKLAHDARDWNLAWQNADAMTRASMELRKPSVIGVFRALPCVRYPRARRLACDIKRSHRLDEGGGNGPRLRLARRSTPSGVRA